MRPLITAVLIVLAPSIPTLTGACSLVPENGGVHALDAQYATDAIAPTITSADTYVVRPGEPAGCACESAGCGDSRWFVRLYMAAADDRAGEYELGYKFRVIGGQAPASLVLPTETVRSSTGEVLLLLSKQERGAIAFDLEIRAVDLNGNESAPTVVSVVAAPT
jgi:hypothetical protein